MTMNLLLVAISVPQWRDLRPDLLPSNEVGRMTDEPIRVGLPPHLDQAVSVPACWIAWWLVARTSLTPSRTPGC